LKNKSKNPADENKEIFKEKIFFKIKEKKTNPLEKVEVTKEIKKEIKKKFIENIKEQITKNKEKPSETNFPIYDFVEVKRIKISKTFPPSDWFDCSEYGNLIEGTNLIPLKAPYTKSLFSPKRFISIQKLKFNREVGLLIDLTDLTKNVYYNSIDLPDGVVVKKLSIR
jgi:hypothetical protein